jgi:hypothetical protein
MDENSDLEYRRLEGIHADAAVQNIQLHAAIGGRRAVHLLSRAAAVSLLLQAPSPLQRSVACFTLVALFSELT